MAHQYIEQMEEEVRDAVFGNVGTMIAFRVGAYDADVLEKEFAPTFIAEDLVNLGLRQIYLKLMIDSVTSQPFSANTLPPIEPQTVSYVNEIIANSRKIFAKTKSEVEQAIVDWHGETQPIASPKPSVRSTEPKPIDTRSLGGDRSSELTASKPKIVVVDRVVAPVVAPKLIIQKPKEAPKISLGDLKNKTNNQRKPDEKNVSALAAALKAIVKEEPKPIQSKPVLASPPKIEEKKNGPSPEELKKLLGVE